MIPTVNLIQVIDMIDYQGYDHEKACAFLDKCQIGPPLRPAILACFAFSENGNTLQNIAGTALVIVPA